MLSPVLLLTFTLSVGIGTALNSPAWQASVRQQVHPRELPEALEAEHLAASLVKLRLSRNAVRERR